MQIHQSLCLSLNFQDQSSQSETTDDSQSRTGSSQVHNQACTRTVAKDQDIPSPHVYAWTDSSVVLGWLGNSTVKWKGIRV